MTIQHDAEKGLFEMLADDGKKMGNLEYRHGGNKDLYATHTLVKRAYEGQGVASQLLDALVAYAKEGGYKIVPICPFVIHAFRKYPEKYAFIMK